MDSLASSSLVLLQAQAPAGAAALVQFVPFVLIFVIFWFLLVRPARQRQKRHQQMLEALKRGDKVITNGGLYGEIAAIEGGVVQLKLADNIKVRVAKSAVSGLQGNSDVAGAFE